jgi:acetolactate synthase I/II/III large subunit
MNRILHTEHDSGLEEARLGTRDDGQALPVEFSAQTSRLEVTKDPLVSSTVLDSSESFTRSPGTLAPSDCSSGIPTPRVRVSEDVAESLAEEPKVGSFKDGGMTGAEVFAKLCRDESLAAMFCAPGNYAIIHALAASGVPSYGGRTEGGMCSAADGFYRASGEVAACSGTEGPGFAHMIMGIGAASAARTPLLILASNSSLEFDDRETGVQNMYQQPLTQGIKKYGKRITSPERVYEYGALAFRYLKSGIPGPVHLDFPVEVSYAQFTDGAQLTDFYDKTRYRTENVAVPSSRDVADVVALIEKAQRPLLIAGHGVFHRRASDVLLTIAEQNELAVVVSGPNRGHFPDDHRLSMNLSPKALLSADLVIFVGQYSMPSRPEYQINPGAQTIRVHPVSEDLGRNWSLDLGVVGDERVFLEMLAGALPARTRTTWVSEIGAARQEFDKELESHYVAGIGYSGIGKVHPAVIGREIYEFFFNGNIDPKQTMTGWGGFTSQRFVPPRLRANRPGQSIITLYQFGAIGVDIPMMVGATAAVKEGIGVQRKYKGAPVLAYCSDADLGYGLFELETAVKYKLPLIVIVYNNNAWGTWVNAKESPRSLHLHLFSENIRYDRMAEHLGVHGEYVRSPDELRGALQRSYDVAARECLPSLINVQAIKEFTSATAYPPGFGLNPEPGVGSHIH